MSKKSVPTITFDVSSKSVKQYVIFAMGGLRFGVPVEQISQIVKFDKVYSLPNTPEYVLGVINLRGKVISLIHLANRLNMTKKADVDKNKQILFVDLGFETVGMLIDRVVTLGNISIDNITDNLDLISSRIDMEFLKGAAFLEDGDVIILLNLDMILTEFEIQDILDHKDQLKFALEEKETVELSETELIRLNLEDDDFTSHSR